MKNKKNEHTLVTTASCDFDEVIIGLMFNLLKQVHPVRRIKHQKKFKRGVDINGETYLIPKDNYFIFSQLYSELEVLYCAESSEITHVLSSFYNIKS